MEVTSFAPTLGMSLTSTYFDKVVSLLDPKVF